MAVIEYIDKNGNIKHTSNTFIDIKGQRFNELEAVRYVGNREWVWRCSCGKEIIRRKNDVVLGRIKSCGHTCNSQRLNTEQAYGEWKIIEQIDTRRVKCKCSCGTERIVYKYDLLKGTTKSCGHSTKGSGINGRKDISNIKIGHWYVKEYIGNQRYRCICECGLEKSLAGNYIRSQKNKKCNHKNTAFINLKDKTFGEWNVLEYKGNYKWLCRCSCGAEKEVTSYDLRSNKSTNCGHNRISYKKGQRYGMLTLLEKGQGLKWRCICECGSIKEYEVSNLISGSTKSCGCLKDKQAETLSELIKQTMLSLIAQNTDIFAEDVAEELNISVVTVHKYIRALGMQNYLSVKFRSRPERDIYNICKQHIENVIYADKEILNGKELDIYIPEKKLAIEYNGSYWHSEERKGTHYHQDKALACLEHNIRLISIFDYEWKDTSIHEKLIHIIENAITNKNIEINEDKLSVASVDIEEAIQFINKQSIKTINHVDISIGCYYRHGLIGVMLFEKIGLGSYELLETCCNTGINIDKSMLGFFINKYNPDQITVNVDIAKQDINKYTELKFTPVELLEPSYKLIKYNLEIIEESDAENNYCMKICDCGRIKLTWSKRC